MVVALMTWANNIEPILGQSLLSHSKVVSYFDQEVEISNNYEPLLIKNECNSSERKVG